MELLGLLAHVDDVVLTEHLGGVSLVTTRSAEGLACNIQMDPDGYAQNHLPKLCGSKRSTKDDGIGADVSV